MPICHNITSDGDDNGYHYADGDDGCYHYADGDDDGYHKYAMMVLMVILMVPTPLLLPSQSEVESAGAEGGSAEQPPSHTTWRKIDI